MIPVPQAIISAASVKRLTTPMVSQKPPGGDCISGTGDDIIMFSVSGTITLGSALPDVNNSGTLTIDGSGQHITIDGANSYQVLEVELADTVTLNDLTIAHGNGGEFSGAVKNSGTLVVTNNTFSDNSSESDGPGAILNVDGTLTVSNTTFSNNSSVYLGGAIYNDNGTATITNSTFSGNSAMAGVLGQSLVGGGAICNAGTMTVTNSIFANSPSGHNCSQTISNGGYNISDDDSCGFGSSTAANGDTVGDDVADANVSLDPSGLANNGGPTETIALESGSYAIGAIPAADCPASDQRAAPRPAPSYTDCSIGAFEYAGVVPSSPIPPTSVSVTGSLAFGNVPVGQTDTKTVKVTNTGKTNALVISGSTPSDSEYALTSTGTCGGIPITVAPKKSCTLGIAFTPNALGTHPASLSLNDNSSTSPQHVTLSGMGVATLTLTKSSLVFGNVKFGLKGVGAFAVVNHQNHAVTLSESFDGTNPADFSISGGTCTARLGALKACSIIVSFSPSVLGTESATLSVAGSPDPLSPYAVALATGPTIPVTIAPVTLAYGTLTARTPTKTKDVTVTNKSGFPLSVSESFSGANTSDFAVTGGTCGGTAPASSSCTIAVTFTPTGGGSSESASMSVSIGNDPSSPHNITLSGTGP